MISWDTTIKGHVTERQQENNTERVILGCKDLQNWLTLALSASQVWDNVLRWIRVILVQHWSFLIAVGGQEKIFICPKIHEFWLLKSQIQSSGSDTDSV